MSSRAPLNPLRFSRQELAGGWGDVGTLFPLLITLIIRNGLNPTTTLLLPALLYISTGLYYRVPVAVQPLKAMSAIAIAQGYGPEMMAAAGLIFGLTMLFLAVTGLIEPLARLFPLPVVRGVQLGLGLILIKTSLGFWNEPIVSGQELYLELGGLRVAVGLLLGAACFVLVAVLRDNPRLPGSLTVLALGLGLGLALGGDGLRHLPLGPEALSLSLPSPSAMATASTALVIPQLPLTLGNAVIVCTAMLHQFYGPGARRVTYRAMLTSTGLVGVAAGVLQGMPLCHGSSGATAHYKLGARTGAAGLLIGVPLALLALLFGSGAVTLLGLIPLPALGALLAYVGLQHALLARDQRQPQAALVTATVAAVALGVGNLAVGFGAGITLYWLLRLGSRLRSGQARRGSSRPPQAGRGVPRLPGSR